MVINERSRLQLHRRLEAIMGPDGAEALMEYLPPVGWGDVATRHDLDHLTVATHRDLEGAELRLKSQIAAVRTELKADIIAVRTELKTEIGDLRTELVDFRTEMKVDMTLLRAGLSDDLRTQTWRMTTMLTGAIVAMAGLIVAAPHF